MTVGHKGKREIKTLASVSYTSDNAKIQSTNYTGFDREVQDAIVSLWLYGDESHVITPAIVARAMSGNSDSVTPPAQRLKKVIGSIEKQRRIDVSIDITEEIKSYAQSRNTVTPENFSISYRKPLLKLIPIDAMSGKNIIHGYYIEE